MPLVACAVYTALCRIFGVSLLTEVTTVAPAVRVLATSLADQASVVALYPEVACRLPTHASHAHHILLLVALPFNHT